MTLMRMEAAAVPTAQQAVNLDSLLPRQHLHDPSVPTASPTSVTVLSVVTLTGVHSTNWWVFLPLPHRLENGTASGYRRLRRHHQHRCRKPHSKPRLPLNQPLSPLKRPIQKSMEAIAIVMRPWQKLKMRRRLRIRRLRRINCPSKNRFVCYFYHWYQIRLI